ncbi:choice-of-anchor J domain-containing protein [Nocardioides houyundeii]|uniref:choice-of-anchor J domain-containing protein n=1 Tax=Nocardioides houyundeii TaxID=2045452 RepID=UPI000DF4011F|nr:choice-of-anchor J domain-containing protein [Nocardioides houyundeii]
MQTEGFDSVVPDGWTATNSSEPEGLLSVFQGNSDIFPAHQGADNAYAAMNYNATGGPSGTISVWLIAPAASTLSNGDRWSFFTRTESWGGFADRLELRLSTEGTCDAGSDATSVGDFTTLLTTVNPNLSNDYPETWTEFSGALSGIRGTKTGCLAFRYFVPDAGDSGVNGNYIGIDTYTYDDQPSDLTAPETTIETGPTGDTQDTTPTFAFSSSEPDSTFECSLDAATFGPCTGPGATHTTDTLTDGPHTFAVRATDAAGNLDPSPATSSFTVDATAPETTIETGPTGDTQDTTPTFAFSSSEPDSTFECSLDAATFGPCTGPGATHTTDTLTDGPHTFAVRATDAAGNLDPSPATSSFTVDATAPETTIETGPTGDTQDTTPTFAFSSSEPDSTFECSLDAATFGPCTGPGATHTTDTLTDGPHTFAVRATDAAGNLDPSPATSSFAVVVPPVVSPTPPTAGPPTSAPSDCSAQQAAVTAAQGVAAKAIARLKRAQKAVTAAKLTLRKAKRDARVTAIKKAKKKVSAAKEKLKTTKHQLKEAQQPLASSTGQLTACQGS